MANKEQLGITGAFQVGDDLRLEAERLKLKLSVHEGRTPQEHKEYWEGQKEYLTQDITLEEAIKRYTQATLSAKIYAKKEEYEAAKCMLNIAAIYQNRIKRLQKAGGGV